MMWISFSETVGYRERERGRERGGILGGNMLKSEGENDECLKIEPTSWRFSFACKSM